MIPFLILVALNRLNIISVSQRDLQRVKSSTLKIFLMVCILIVTSVQAFSLPTKEKPLVFQVMKNEKIIGTISMTKNSLGDSVIFYSESHINTKLLFNFKITGIEESVFKNGVMLRSTVYRTLNDKVKSDHSIRQIGHQYFIKEGSKIRELKLPEINHNLLSLYFKEPKSVDQIFCDNQKEMNKVHCLGNGTYKIQISRTKYNVFHYKAGTCVKVEIFTPMFDVVLKLK